MFVRLVKAVTTFIKRVHSRISGLFIHLLFFDNIYTCNIRRFEKVSEFDNYRYLKRFGFGFGGQKVYQNMILAIVDEFGASSKFEKIFFIKKTILMLTLKKIKARTRKGDQASKKFDTLIKVKHRELENILKDNDGDGEDVRKSNASQHRILSEWCKQDTRKMTVFEFNNCSNDYKKFVEDGRKKNNIR